MGGDAVKVVLLTRGDVGQEWIVCHTNTFQPNRYRFATQETTLATAEGGIRTELDALCRP